VYWGQVMSQKTQARRGRGRRILLAAMTTIETSRICREPPVCVGFTVSMSFDTSVEARRWLWLEVSGPAPWRSPDPSFLLFPVSVYSREDRPPEPV
jgi:hypothetical protein